MSQNASQSFPIPNSPQSQLPANTGWIRITNKGNALTSWDPPTVTVNDHVVTTAYGTTDVPMPAGVHRVEGFVKALWKYGHASMDVEVTPGAVVPVFYTAPSFMFLKGSIGHEPQKTRGLVVYIVLLALVALAFIFMYYSGVFTR